MKSNWHRKLCREQGRPPECYAGSSTPCIAFKLQLTELWVVGIQCPFQCHQAPQGLPFSQSIMLWRRTVFQETRLFLPPYFPAAPDDPRGRGVPQRHYFQNISRGLANLKGSKTVGQDGLSQSGFPIHLLPGYSAPCKYLLCRWTQPWAGSQGGMEKVHTHRTHTALDKLAMSS